MSILGIDLGTTNSLAAVWRNGKSALIPNSFGEVLTPSAVSIDDDGSILIGQIAKERLVSHPERSAASFKRAMGTDTRFTLAGQIFSAEDLSSFILRRLKQDAEIYLGEPVTEAVISVPAYFNDHQRSATKRAGHLAGLRVERLINEPSAAALACRMEDGEQECTYLIIDFGGGTLDVSLVECFDNVVEIAAISGDNHLGGDDFNSAIAAHFCRENRLDPDALPPIAGAILRKQAEQCKMVLSEHDTAIMALEMEQGAFSMALDRNMLIELSAPIFQRILQPVKRVLQDSGTSLSNVDDIILVGGSCKMPIVREYLGYTLGRSVRAVSPDRIVALGAGAYAGIKERKLDIRDLVLTDICPFTLGVAVHNSGNPDEPLMSPLIERNSLLPCSKSDSYCTASDNQKVLQIRVFQGESMYCAHNLFLGDVVIDVPPAPEGHECVDVRFTYDINGILELEVTSKTTKETRKALLVSPESGMTKEEVERRLQQLSALKIHPRDDEENRAVIARGQRLFAESLGNTRRRVMQTIVWFKEILETQDTRKIKHARDYVTGIFNAMEEDAWPPHQ